MTIENRNKKENNCNEHKPCSSNHNGNRGPPPNSFYHLGRFESGYEKL